jgi:hypothetical protein
LPPRNWTIAERGDIRDGERLYAVRMIRTEATPSSRSHQSGDEPAARDARGVSQSIEFLPLKATSRREFAPPPVPGSAFHVVTTPFGTRIVPGWSGAFVGRYDEASGRWEFVGLLSSTTRPRPFSRQLAAVVRPPDDVLDWLLHGTPINPEHTVEARLEQWRERLGDPP